VHASPSKTDRRPARIGARNACVATHPDRGHFSGELIRAAARGGAPLRIIFPERREGKTPTCRVFKEIGAFRRVS
jgi:hypothetical protein